MDFKHQNQLVVKLWEDLQVEYNIPSSIVQEDGALHSLDKKQGETKLIPSSSLATNRSLAEKTSLDIRIMDAYDINIFRQDSHRGRIPLTKDCLHNCHPGKVDVYNSIFLHYLRQSELFIKELPTQMTTS